MRGGFPIFRVAGIQVYLHFTWFLVAWYEINSSKFRYQSPSWAAVEYVGLFAIVLLHEFGHAFACRSVGGRADHIVLWPLGGLAFVDPPSRPGAVLWSIAAGPLVNVVLVPLFFFATFAVEGFRRETDSRATVALPSLPPRSRSVGTCIASRPRKPPSRWRWRRLPRRRWR